MCRVAVNSVAGVRLTELPGDTQRYRHGRRARDCRWGGIIDHDGVGTGIGVAAGIRGDPGPGDDVAVGATDIADDVW